MKYLSFAVLFLMLSSPLLPQEITQPAGKSEVYFYRIPDYVGSGLKMTICIDNEPIVRLLKNSFYRHTVSAGDHEFSFGFGSSMKLRVKTEPGKSYYIRCSFNMGLWSGIPVMELMEPVSGKATIDGQGLSEQFYTPVSTGPIKSRLAITMGGGIGFEQVAWFVDENNDDVNLSTGGGFNIGAEYGYQVNRYLEIALNCSFIGSSLSRSLSNASGSFNRMGLSITPSLVIPIKGGNMFRIKAGAGAGLYSFGTMKIDASQLGDDKYTFKYKSAPGIVGQVMFEYNFSEKGATGLGVRYENIRYKFSPDGSSHTPVDPRVINPDGSGIIFMLNYSFLF